MWETHGGSRPAQSNCTASRSDSPSQLLYARAGTPIADRACCLGAEMGRIISFGVLALLVGAGVVLGATWSTVVLGAAATGVAGWCFKCRHPGPLGLLPPVDEASGIRMPARWYCDRCGHSWPAGIDHGRPPVPRFTGYDESKAIGAARRAEELSVRQRDLAVRRAGLDRAAAHRRLPRRGTTPFKRPTGPMPVRGQRAAS